MNNESYQKERKKILFIVLTKQIRKKVLLFLRIIFISSTLLLLFLFQKTQNPLVFFGIGLVIVLEIFLKEKIIHFFVNKKVLKLSEKQENDMIFSYVQEIFCINENQIKNLKKNLELSEGNEKIKLEEQIKEIKKNNEKLKHLLPP